MIKPQLRRAWRDHTTLQYGVTPAHARLLGPLDQRMTDFLRLLDGTRHRARLRLDAQPLGLTTREVDRWLDRLCHAGLVEDAHGQHTARAEFGPRLHPDLSALSLRHPTPGGAADTLRARAGALVVVRGAGRVGAQVAAALSSSGVGAVEVTDTGRVDPWDLAPAGLSPEQTGHQRAPAARRTVRRHRPDPGPGPDRDHARDRPDPARLVPGPRRSPRSRGRTERTAQLVVLAPREGLDAYSPCVPSARELLSTGVPHLYAGVLEGTGVVGPLVLPGRSPCGECLFRQRADSSPGWGPLVAQWRTPRRPPRGAPACDTALAMVVAGFAASLALSLLDGEGTWGTGRQHRLDSPAPVPETETFDAHRECGCGAALVAEPVPASTEKAGDSTMAT
ncbi:ThiF family adenylyltransferase [Streptomyces sp. NPDC005438]|uniref:ThiF family adenylyltransferase n=1 Tax=Streptomyces sp. NPDC005438 TaxID=3156880 RepID=UPI0033A27394